MPLTGRNFYGVQVQRTPYDDAEAQRAVSQDAWNMAQYQNDWAERRFQQGRGDAWAMNRDNLNFNKYALDRADVRSAAAIEAQRKIAEMGFAHDKTMFDRRADVEDARTLAGWDREDAIDERNWNRDAAGRAARDAAAKSQALYYERMDKEANDRDARNKALQAVMSTPEGRDAARAGQYDVISELMAKQNPGALLPADYYLQLMQQREANTRAAEQNRAMALMPQIQTLRNRGQTKEADALIATLPGHLRSWVPPADAVKDPRTIAEATELPARQALDAARKRTRGLMRDATGAGAFGDFSMKPQGDPKDEAARLESAIKMQAASLAKKYNLDPLEIEAELRQEAMSNAKTGFWNWLKAESQGGIVDELRRNQ